MSKLSQNLCKLSYDASGSKKSKADREKHLLKFCDFLRSNNINIEHVTHIKESHIKLYVEFRKNGSDTEDAVSVATICNEMVSIRKVLRQADRHQLLKSPDLTNQALGISGRKRTGNKEPIPPELLKKFIEDAFKKDRGLGVCVLLSVQLGLRAEETVQSCKSLFTWRKFIAKEDSKVKIVYGSKGGRDRFTKIINLEDLEHTVNFAIQIASSRGGKLIEKSNLKKAMQYYSNSLRSIGMIGKYAPHALRYSYTDNLLFYLESQGYSKHEALAITSCSLGHGDGRGRYIQSTYGKVRLANKSFSLSEIGINIQLKDSSN
ncbi:MAG TPA: integrase domain-containing protein [Methylotenera sp.]|nr:integrase domain-containing protein [Methylotenera sp.]HPH08562.1 integrase domain-containing protein [Methylotenera sp.]HPM48696.1 integrase domain-containing protein [Methylotenera sp.]